MRRVAPREFRRRTRVHVASERLSATRGTFTTGAGFDDVCTGNFLAVGFILRETFEIVILRSVEGCGTLVRVNTRLVRALVT